MRRLLQKLFIVAVAVTLVANASAFSLMGPFASWQTAAIGYNLPGDVGGPMILSEDYRITVPVLNYGFDGTFLSFFGANGVAAVNAAMAILNAVPAASAMTDDYLNSPAVSTEAIADNAGAKSLGILDLKSAVLSTVLGQMGLASPERWAFTLRDRSIIGNRTNYTVVQRNYDPITLLPTNIVNSKLYTYNVVEPANPPLGTYADAVETQVGGGPANDDKNKNISVAGVSDLGGLSSGRFFTGLTRDDLGGLRYLLRFNNVNMESLAANVTLEATNSPPPSPPPSPFGPYNPFLNLGITPLVTNSPSPFGPYIPTNAVVLPPSTTNGGGFPGGGFPGGGSANIPGLTLIAPTNAPTNAQTNIPPVILARRPGIDKVSFNPIALDSLLGIVVRAVTNRYVDQYFNPTNNVLTNQLVQRVVDLPDILFAAGDRPPLVLGGSLSGATLVRPTSTRWVNNSALPGNTYAGGAARSGPGVIPAALSNATAIVIEFNTLGASRSQTSQAGRSVLLNEEGGIRNGVWGYFNASEIFSVFPDGLTIQNLERQLYGP